MKITYKEGEGLILFEDKDSLGRVRGAIAFQIKDGRYTIYIKGYEVDSKKFPYLKGFHGYTLTDNETDRLLKFVNKLDSKDDVK
jgi:hypothetical protein